MFGSIGQPVSGVKSDRTARVFLRLQRDEAAKRDEGKRRHHLRRHRLLRTLKGWFKRDGS